MHNSLKAELDKATKGDIAYGVGKIPEKRRKLNTKMGWNKHRCDAFRRTRICFAFRDCLRFQMIEMKKVCKWYVVCPMKRFFEEGRLEQKWIEEYCMGDYKRCVRYKLEEAGIPHPDNMLPNGKIMKSL